MDILLDDQEIQIKEAASEFLAGECSSALVRQVETDALQYSPALWTKFAENGWLQLCLSEKNGGEALPLTYLGLLFELAGYHIAPIPLHSTMVPAMVIDRHGSPEQQQLLQDVLAGQLDFYFDPGIGLAQVRAGKLKLMAVGSLKRSPLFPNVPTLEEAGLKGFDADSVFGFYAPTGTPAEVVTKLNREINRILATPALKDRIQNLGGEALPLSPAEFGALASDDSKRFGAIIR